MDLINAKDRPLVYLASPYSDPNVTIMQYRADIAAKVNAYFCRMGELVYSPIAHWHHIACKYGLPTGIEFWAEFDRKMILSCDELRVLMLDGWQDSIGVQAEIALAINFGIPITYSKHDSMIR